jgi:hypothetical protein
MVSDLLRLLHTAITVIMGLLIALHLHEIVVVLTDILSEIQ